MLGRLHTVNGYLVVDGDQSLAIATVERGGQIGERLAPARQRRPRVTEGCDPAGEVTSGVQPVVSRVKIENRRASRQSVQYELLLVGHGHVRFLLYRLST